MIRIADRVVVGDAVRFLIAGGLNTLFTIIVYQLLLFVIAPLPAYAISWVAGLAVVTIAYPSRVFAGARRDARARARLAASYALTFVLGLGALHLFERAGIPPRLAIVAVLFVTTAVNFVVGRLILRPDRTMGIPG